MRKQFTVSLTFNVSLTARPTYAVTLNPSFNFTNDVRGDRANR